MARRQCPYRGARFSVSVRKIDDAGPPTEDRRSYMEASTQNIQRAEEFANHKGHERRKIREFLVKC